MDSVKKRCETGVLFIIDEVWKTLGRSLGLKERELDWLELMFAEPTENDVMSFVKFILC